MHTLDPNPLPSTIDGRTALTDSAWAEGVRVWMAAPRTETIMKRPWAYAKLQKIKQVTGLPTALKLHWHPLNAESNSTPLAERVDAALEGKGEDDDGCLSLKLNKLNGLPGVTFVWTCVPCLGGSWGKEAGADDLIFI